MSIVAEEKHAYTKSLNSHRLVGYINEDDMIYMYCKAGKWIPKIKCLIKEVLERFKVCPLTKKKQVSSR